MAKILIVEDEPDIGELYRLSLEAAGHSIVGLYADPARALDEATTLSAPDLVILDERLGDNSGSEFLYRFRAAFAHAILFLVSADAEVVREATAHGFDEAVRKPITLRRLVANVADLLDGTGPRQS